MGKMGAEDKMRPVEREFIWRGDGRLEMECIHGVGHTTSALVPGDTEIETRAAYYSHGCDGCCGKDQVYARLYRHVLGLRIARDAKNQAEVDLAGITEHYLACAEELEQVKAEFQGFRDGVTGEADSKDCPRLIEEMKRHHEAPTSVVQRNLLRRHGQDGCRCLGVGYWFE